MYLKYLQNLIQSHAVTAAPLRMGLRMTDRDSTDILHGVAAIGDFLKIKPRRVHHLIDNSGLRVFKLGGRVCARKSSLEAWISEQEEKFSINNTEKGL